MGATSGAGTYYPSRAPEFRRRQIKQRETGNIGYTRRRQIKQRETGNIGYTRRRQIKRQSRGNIGGTQDEEKQNDNPEAT